MKPTFFASARALRTWLARNHGSAPELLLGLHKKGSDVPSVTWPEAVDQALCFGWIDGVRKRLDDSRYTIRFAPRRPGSTWSAVNIDRIAELEASGLMRPSGREAFARRSEQRSRTYSYEQSGTATLDGPLARVLEADAKAVAFFRAQAPSYRRKVVHWVMTAKGSDVRRTRLERLIAAFRSGRRL